MLSDTLFLIYTFNWLVILPISWRYRSEIMYQITLLNGNYIIKKLFSLIKSISQKKSCQINIHKCGFYVLYQLSVINGIILVTHWSISYQIMTFLKTGHFMGSQCRMVTGTGSEIVWKNGINYHFSVPRSTNDNPYESSIRGVIKRFNWVVLRKKKPKWLWDYIIDWVF